MAVDDQPQGFFWIIIILVLLGFVTAVFFLRDRAVMIDKPPAGIHTPRTFTITYDKGFFSPTNIRVTAGDIVIFRNSSPTIVTISSTDETFTDIVIASNTQVSHNFQTVGIFHYQNVRNEHESGNINVRPTP